MNSRFLIFILSFLFFSCSEEENELETWGRKDASFQRCIWDKAPHCAFTGLVEYNGKYYCCFREGRAHVPTSRDDYGKIRILESTDGKEWSSVGCVGDKDHDLRDPKLSVTPDNRLMLMYGCANFADDQLVFRKTEVRFLPGNISSHQLSFGVANKISIQQDNSLSQYWLWRVVWNNNVAYGVAYKGGAYPLLLRSTDGINYSLIAELAVNGNEADIEFLADGSMMIVIRGVWTNGYIGTSQYPYTEWEWKDCEYLVHCPDIITLDGQLFVAARGLDGTMLYHITNQMLNPIYAFSGGGDNAYPGVIRVNDELWMSYYAGIGKSSIYFVKIPISKIFSRLE